MEGAIKHTLGIKDKDKDKKGGGGLFGGNKNKEQEKKDKGKGGFISNRFKKGDDDKVEGRASGFTGLFSEPGGAGAAGESDGGLCEYNPSVENEGQSGGTGGGMYEVTSSGLCFCTCVTSHLLGAETRGYMCRSRSRQHDHMTLTQSGS